MAEKLTEEAFIAMGFVRGGLHLALRLPVLVPDAERIVMTAVPDDDEWLLSLIQHECASIDLLPVDADIVALTCGRFRTTEDVRRLIAGLTPNH